jgi:MBG domain/IPT/TIG domain
MSFVPIFSKSVFASVFVSGPFASSRPVRMRVLAGALLLVPVGACLSASAGTKRWLDQMGKKCARFALAAAAAGALLSGAPMYAATGSIFTANVGANQVTLELTSSATGTGYFTLLPGASTTCGTAAQTVAGENSAGAAAFRTGSLRLTATVAGNYTVKNLTASTAYTVCFTPDGVATPVTGNVTTAAATAFSTAAWTTAGSAGISGGAAPYMSLAFSPSGTLYLAYQDAGNSSKATVMKLTVDNWDPVGNPFGFSAGAALYMSLAFSPSGTPYVAYMDDAHSDKATVMEYNGTSWVTVGSAGFSAGAAYSMSLAFSPSGTPYVAYSDDRSGTGTGPATVMEYNGTSWVTVGSADFSAGPAYYTSLAFSPSGIPYVAYSDDSTGKGSGPATVMEYNGTSWVVVGSAGFSAGAVYYTSLAFSPSGTPYVAYSDDSTDNGSGPATVMEYNGTSWVTVGSAGFSAGVALYESLAFSPSGTPYVAYMDDLANSNKATVMEYNGTSWVVVVSAGFSAGLAQDESLAFSPDGTPYVAYQDFAHSKRATVMKLVTVPAATTGAATSITGSGATLNGTVNDDGVATGVGFQYGITSSYGTAVFATTPPGGALSAGSGSTAASVDLSSLTPGTTYHFRVFATATATGNGVTIAGSDATFTTLVVPVVAAISPASGPSAGGTSITITGKGFTNATIVSFGSTAAASYTVISATQIAAVSSPGSPGNVHITVTTFSATSSTSSADQFTYQKLTPTVRAASPSVVYGTSSATLTASVAYTGATAPTGSLTFTVNGSTTGVGTVTCTGSASPLSCSASYNTASLPTGSYAIVATEATDSNYLAASNTASASLTVSQATAAITFSVANHTYGDAPFAVSASSSSTGAFTYSVVSGPATVLGSTVSLTGAGPVVLQASQAADSNYSAGAMTALFSVAKASATVSLGNLARVYTGSPLSVTSTTNPVGLNVLYTYNGSSAAPTAAGSYAVVGTVSDSNYSGTGNGTLVISKIAASIALSGLTVTYNGTGHAATATTTPAGLAVTFTYNGSVIEPVLAGTYAVVATISDARYQGTQTGSMVISAVASSPALLTTTIVITNIGNGYQMAITEKNSGGTAAANVQLTSASLGAAIGTPLPASFGNIAAGGSASVLLNFSASAGASEATVVAKVNGSYTGGTFGSSLRTVLPAPLP